MFLIISIFKETSLALKLRFLFWNNLHAALFNLKNTVSNIYIYEVGLKKMLYIKLKTSVGLKTLKLVPYGRKLSYI